MLTEARAYAYARCGPGSSFAAAGSEVTRTVVGACVQRAGAQPVPAGFPAGEPPAPTAPTVAAPPGG